MNGDNHNDAMGARIFHADLIPDAVKTVNEVRLVMQEFDGSDLLIFILSVMPDLFILSVMPDLIRHPCLYRREAPVQKRGLMNRKGRIKCGMTESLI